MRCRLREHRVQRDDERLRELLGERQHVLAVGAAEDPVFVLEQHDVDVEPAEDPRRAHVVAADRLRDRRENTAPLRARRLVDDRDEIDAFDPVDVVERPPQVGRERADPADPRRIRGDDRGTQIQPPPGTPRPTGTRVGPCSIGALRGDSPEQQAAGSCGSQDTGRWRQPSTRPLRRNPRATSGSSGASAPRRCPLRPSACARAGPSPCRSCSRSGPDASRVRSA